MVGFDRFDPRNLGFFHVKCLIWDFLGRKDGDRCFFGGFVCMKSKQIVEGGGNSNVICLIFALEMIQFDTSHFVK